MFSSKLKFLCGMIAACILAFAPAVGEAQKDDLKKEIQKLKKRVAALEEAHEPMYLTVDCGAGDTVADALAEAEKTTGHVNITIKGICIEVVDVSRGSITIQGDSEGSGLQAPHPDNSTLNIFGVQDVSLHQLTILGGRVGLEAGAGATFQASRLEVTGAYRGINVFRGSAEIQESTFNNNQRDAVTVGHGGHVRLYASEMKDNGRQGIHVDGGSIEEYDSTISGNSTGIYVFNGGQVRISGTTIENNWHGIALENGSNLEMFNGIIASGETGIFMRGGSHINLNGTKVEWNTDVGIRAHGGSTILLKYGTQVRNNEGDGIILTDTSVLGTEGTIELLDNGRWGIRCWGPPSVAQLAPYSSISASGNWSGQIGCPQN